MAVFSSSCVLHVEVKITFNHAPSDDLGKLLELSLFTRLNPFFNILRKTSEGASPSAEAYLGEFIILIYSTH